MSKCSGMCAGGMRDVRDNKLLVASAKSLVSAHARFRVESNYRSILFVRLIDM